MNDRIFAALADDNRRTMVEALARDGGTTATGFASRLDISRQAAAKHLRVLADAGLVDAHRVGRETRYTTRPNALGAVSDWVARVESAWTTRLDALGDALDR